MDYCFFLPYSQEPGLNPLLVGLQVDSQPLPRLAITPEPASRIMNIIKIHYPLSLRVRH